MARTQPQMVAVPMMIMTMAVVIPALTNSLGMSESLSVFMTKMVITKAYPTATAEASVGVNIPLMIPPMMMSGISRAKNTSFKVTKNSLTVTFSSLLGYFSFTDQMNAAAIKKSPRRMPGITPARKRAPMEVLHEMA